MPKRLLKIAKWFFGILISIFLLISLLLYVYKDDICNMAIAKMNEHLQAKVKVSKVDLAFWGTFPNLAVDFDEVFIQDKFANSTASDTMLYSEKIRFKFNPMDLWNENYEVKSVEIGKGTLQLKVDQQGENNYNILKPSTDTTASDFKLQLNDVFIENLRFKYQNKATDQLYSADIAQMTVAGELNNAKFKANASSELTINSAQSGEINFVRNQKASINVGVHVDTDSGTVVIPTSVISIAQLPFEFNLDYDTTQFDFRLTGKNISIAEAANKLSLKQTAEVEKFSGTGNLLFDLKVHGNNQATVPAEIHCDFGVDNGMVKDPTTKVVLSKINLNGKYTNTDKKLGEKLELSKISFESTGGQFDGQLLLFNFDEPEYKGYARGNLNLPTLQSFLRIPIIEKVSGNVVLASNFHFQSHPQENGPDNFQIHRCTGTMDIHEVNLKLVDDKREFKHVNGSTYLKNDEIGFDNINLNIGYSDFAVNGAFRKLSDYLSHRGQLLADVDISSKLIRIADIGSDSKQEIRESERAFILPDDIDGKAYINVDKMLYEGHTFENMKGRMVVGKRFIQFPDISIRNGGADARGSITIEEKRPEIFYINSQLVSDNISFAPMFKEWNNFQQDVISSKNISGTAIANIQFSAPFDFRSGIISNAIEAKIGIKIIDGRLRNVETFKYITQSLKETPAARLAIGKDNINAFEKKLLDLQFEELTNTLLIKNSVLTIPSMSIKSNALDMEASGKHTFDNKIDYRIGFRFRDVKQEQTSEFGTVIDDGSGQFVFLRMYGPMSDPTIEWDKQASREKRKQDIAEEKEDVKSILKSEFGLYKNDTTVQEYIQEKNPHETLEIEFDPDESVDPILKKEKPKKDTRTNRFLEKIKKEAEKAKEEEEEEFIIDGF